MYAVKHTLEFNIVIIQRLPTKYKMQSKCIHIVGQFILKVKHFLLVLSPYPRKYMGSD